VGFRPSSVATGSNAPRRINNALGEGRDLEAAGLGRHELIGAVIGQLSGCLMIAAPDFLSPVRRPGIAGDG
jgi:hypothetical protein